MPAKLRMLRSSPRTPCTRKYRIRARTHIVTTSPAERPASRPASMTLDLSSPRIALIKRRFTVNKPLCRLYLPLDGEDVPSLWHVLLDAGPIDGRRRSEVMKRTIAPWVTVLGLILGLSGCTNPYDPAQRAVGGGLLGAGAGAAIGAAAGGGHGAALGAAIGGAAGALGGVATTPPPPAYGYYGSPGYYGYYQ
jgi:hypothetical protein